MTMTAVAHQELLNRRLPKWPRHYVTGMPVSVEQAKEIIRRTDLFFTCGLGGNDRKYDSWVKSSLGMVEDDDKRPTDDDRLEEYFTERTAREEAWRANWGTIQTAYVHNSWVSSCYADGPFGWCRPDGQIGFDGNIGKRPDVPDVLADWTALARAFPFLEIGATLYSGEIGNDETDPVASFAVKSGAVELVDPAHINVHRDHPIPGSTEFNFGVIMAALVRNNYQHEHGLPHFWIEEWSKRLGK
jgi:hypothetical protein